MSPSVAAAIVAGGRARRFDGRDKSRLLVEGRPIINRQMEILQQLTDQIFVVAGDASRFADLGLPVHADLVPGIGAIGGIYTAVEVATAECVLTVACDLPFLDARLLARLVTLAAGRDGAWVRAARGPEPFLACYQRTARARILARIDAGQLKASELGATLDLAELDEDEVARFGPVERLLANVNTPEDYERLKA